MLQSNKCTATSLDQSSRGKNLLFLCNTNSNYMYRHYILQNINYRKLNDLFNDFCCFEEKKIPMLMRLVFV